jgi:hypothetical protein
VNQREVRKLIAGPTVYICDQCIKRCNEIIAEEANRPEPTPETKPAPPRQHTRSNQLLRCSFCGKTQREVRKLIAGPTVYICDECIGLCNEIIVEEIDLEKVAGAFSSVLPEDARAFLATILDRGSGAAARLSDIADNRDRRFRFADRVLLRVLDWLDRRVSQRTLALASLRDLTSGWMTLRTIVGSREAVPPASSPGAEVELPAWVRPVADRLTATVEVLEPLTASLDKGRPRGIARFSRMGCCATAPCTRPPDGRPTEAAYRQLIDRGHPSRYLPAPT